MPNSARVKPTQAVTTRHAVAAKKSDPDKPTRPSPRRPSRGATRAGTDSPFCVISEGFFMYLNPWGRCRERSDRPIDGSARIQKNRHSVGHILQWNGALERTRERP